MDGVLKLRNTVNAVFGEELWPLLNVIAIKHSTIFRVKIFYSCTRNQRVLVSDLLLFESWQHLEPHDFTVVFVHRADSSFRDQVVCGTDFLGVEF